MPREYQPFEQDFLLVTQPEGRIEQATRNAQIATAMLAAPDDDLWAWEDTTPDNVHTIRDLFEECATVWELMLERL
jgi:hypothetical protein